ncbi:MAG: hypothetical protein CMJ64_09155 [Planctomycetaceae bacterium]|nr:hypothetical protein [Planctomycetaceae bacterium]
MRLQAVLALIGCAIAGRAFGDEIDYLSQVKPLLASKCYSCHGALKQQAELRLETRALMLAGGDSGQVVVPGSADKSRIVARISAKEDERMPPQDEGSLLTADEIALIRMWIDQGAKAPDEPAPADPRQHWSFQKPVRPEVPGVKNAAWSHNPIDAFLAAGHERHGLVPLEVAEKHVLLRRLYLDLIGLPPMREELHEFLADDAEDAYEKVVTRLLKHPGYGERWGRHWMDVWRYSDWYGLGAQVRYSQKHIWRWRDWIIESLNEDKPYDRMVVEMLAGDEIAPSDPDTVRATGFLARNYFLFNRTTWLDSTVEHTSKALLGLTLNCARCHDHKYDPLSQTDYYQMRAIFEPHQVRVDPVPGETDLDRNGLSRAFDNEPDAPTYLFVRGNEKSPDKSQIIAPGIPSVLAASDFNPQPITLPAEAYAPGLQPFALADHLAAAAKRIEAARTSVNAAKQQMQATERVAAGKSEKPRTAPVGEFVLRDDFDKPNPDVWEAGPGEWKYTDGKLVQGRAGAGLTSLYYRTRSEHPNDFLATCKLTVTSAAGLGSAGFRFDATSSRDKFVYLSVSGSKVQIAHGMSPNYTYPRDAKNDQPFKKDVAYELTIRVQNKLVNVAIDGKHAIAYELSVEREAGRLDLVAYDASVEFDSVEIRKLPPDAVLVLAKPPPSIDVARAALIAAEKSLPAAELHAPALQSAFAADLAKANESVDTAALVRDAALAARRYEFAQAEQAVAKAEYEVAAAGSDKRAAAEKSLASARAARDQAAAKLEEPGDTYTSLYVSKRAANGMIDEATPRHGPYSKVSTGRRTALARWIASRDNPLAARVAVNHIWLRHFGQPLVASMMDFGLRTKQPPQHELLDWLAVEFMENGWSMKHLHRLIVTSRAYQLRSSLLAADESTRQADPDNDYYWCRKPLRMESQVVRDSLLHLAGVLDAKLGGPTVPPASEDTVFRRSLYFTHSRDDRAKLISMFDDADIVQCYRRTESIVPQQALALANSKLALTMSRKIAAQLEMKLGEASNEQFIAAAFETVLLVPPIAEESAVCLAAIKQTVATLEKLEHASPQPRARENLVHVLLNHNDFVTIR